MLSFFILVSTLLFFYLVSVFLFLFFARLFFPFVFRSILFRVRCYSSFLVFCVLEAFLLCVFE